MYPGTPGSSLCAGKTNGNRSYMMEVTKPMGTYHIIDGEKVSIKYRGQDRTCAKCHKTESVCPGKALAKDCTSERVMLSTHMQDHWEKVGYRPDTIELNEVDVLDVQIGRKEAEPAPSDSLRPDHTAKYSSVKINGFSKTAEEQEIYNILLEGGLPSTYKIEDIKKNEKTGQLLIDSLDPNVCVSLTQHISGNTFFNKKVFVTSVVQKTPVKDSLVTVTEAISDTVVSSESSSDNSADDDDEAPSPEKPPCSRLFTMISEPVKRPAVTSPEISSENKKKDKKKKKADSPKSVRSSSRQVQGKPTNKK